MSWPALALLTAVALAGCSSSTPEALPSSDGGGAGGATGAAGGPSGGSGGGVAGFNIQLDYRFDTKKRFADPVLRATLEAAAQQWASIIAEKFDDIPAGTEILMRDPQAPAEPATVWPIDYAIDDLLVFVGFADIDGPGGLLALSFPPAAIASVSDSVLAAQLDARYHGSDFQPWVGWISFDETAPWFVGHGEQDDIGKDQFDFYTVAMHEFGHLLGVGTCDRYADLVNTDDAFVGALAVAEYGGAIPLTKDHGHIHSSVLIDGQRPLLDASEAPGERYLITRLDRAMVADLGFAITP